MDRLKAIRILAAKAVKDRDVEYFMRFAKRWYSREFHTPLPQVDQIPDEEVLEHFFEVRYENMDEEDFEDEVTRLCETPEETAAREAAEEQEKAKDEDWYQEVLREEQERLTREAKKAGKKPPLAPVRRDEEPIVTPPVPVMGSNLPTTFSEDSPIRDLPPDIKLEFAEEGELDDVDDWDMLGPPKKK